MRSFFLSLALTVAGGCYQPDQPVDRGVDPSVINFDNSVDISDDGTVFVGYEQSPDSANPNQPVSIYCYGEDSPGWQDGGCWTALQVFEGEDFQGFAQKLPPDGVFRMGFGNRPVTNQPDDPNWFDHAVGIDTSEEWEWMFEFEECGLQKLNICARMVDGHAEPAKADCGALYVPPPNCP